MENASFYYYEYNNTEDEEHINPSVVLTLQILEVICYSITFVLGIIGNGLVIWIAGFKMEKTVSSLWFLNLAIADFVFVMILPPQITEVIMGGHWPFGKTMCKVLYTVFFLNMSVSASFLTIISVDRCTSVLCPVWSKNHRSPRMALIISAITWAICFKLTSPYVVFLDIEHNIEYGILYCGNIYAEDYAKGTRENQTVIVVGFVSMFLIPFLIIVTCYSLILFRLRRSRSLSRSNKPLKVIITIILCFFCFSFPYHTYPVVQGFHVEVENTVDSILYSLTNCLGFFNSCVNPIIYVFVGRDFKNILLKSIPFLLENTLKEKEDSDIGPRSHQTTEETEV